MLIDYKADVAKTLINSENVNVTETNPFRELAKILVQLLLFIAIIYVIVFFTSGVIIKSLPREKQVFIENLISMKLPDNIYVLSHREQARVDKVTENIINSDDNFDVSYEPKVYVVNDDNLNAYCFPNGNIYITLGLFKKLDTADKMTFVISHEIAHYKNRDHMLILRRNISDLSILLLLLVADPNNKNLQKLIGDGLNMADLKYSRTQEKEADKYAVERLNKIYGNAYAGAEVLQILKDDKDFGFEFISTHPNTDKRIKYIQKLSD